MWFLLPILVGALSGFAAASIVAVVESYLDEATLPDFVKAQILLAAREKKEYYKAFKILIKEKKENAVSCGIFDKDDEHLGDMEIKASQGVSPNLREGMTVYL